MSVVRLAALRAIVRQSARERALALAIPGSGSEGTARMTNTGPRQIRDAANELLDAFIRAIEQSYAGRPVNAADLRRVADALKGSPDFDALFDRAFSDVQSQALAHAPPQAHAAHRVGMFHPVLTPPPDPLPAAPALNPAPRPHFLQFLPLL